MLVVSVLLACRSPEPSPGGAAGGNATLVDLVIPGRELVPPFSPDIHAYRVRAGAEDPVAVVATPASPPATVEVTAATFSGDPVDTDPLVLAAEQRITVEVTAGEASETYTVVVVPEEFPEITVAAPGVRTPGSVWLATLPGSVAPPFLAVVDGNGVPSWYQAAAGQAYDLRPGPEGGTFVGVGDPNEGVVLDPTFAETRRWIPHPGHDGSELALNVHEFEALDDGGVLLMGMYGAPRDLTRWGGPADGQIAHTVVQEIGPDGDLRFQWSTDGAIDLDTVPFWVQEPLVDGWDYAHLNSVAIDPDDGNLVVSVRLTSQVLKVARFETEMRGLRFQPGEILWRLGGPHANVRFVDDVRSDGWRGFWGQHSARPLPGGRLLVFDNAVRREARGETFQDQEIDLVDTGGTRFVEYQLDPTAMTARRVADHQNAAGVFTQAGGSVQRLPDGHTLIGWGDLPATVGSGPSVTELDAAGEVVWELTLPPGLWSYRAWWSP